MRRVLISVATATTLLAGVATAPTALADVHPGPTRTEAVGVSAPEPITAPRPAPLTGDEAFAPPGSAPVTASLVGEQGPQPVTVPGTKGSEWWLSWTRSGASVKTWENIRWSWSFQYFMRSKLGYQQGFVTAACAFVPSTPAKAACALAANTFYTYVKNLVENGIATKRCLQYKVPVTTNAATVASQTRFWLITCRH
jgi:hypothetical protein